MIALRNQLLDVVFQEDRMQTVATLVSTVQELMDELKISPTTALDNRILGSLAIPSSSGAPVLQTTEVLRTLRPFPQQFFVCSGKPNPNPIRLLTALPQFKPVA